MYGKNITLLIYVGVLFINISCTPMQNQPEKSTITDEKGHQHHAMQKDDHAEHRAMIVEKYYKTTYTTNTLEYHTSGLSLLRMDESAVLLENELASNEPVILNFIFTSCTTVCPVLSATFSQFQNQLGDEAKKVKMISISIDPEYDTPAKLRQYAKKFSAGPQWQFYTGNVAQSEMAQKAFNAYRGGKMNHIPLTFIRAAGKTSWLRLEGFTSAADLVKEYKRMISSSAPKNIVNG